MDGRAEPHGRLAGIVKVPLDCAPTIAAAGDPVTLAQGVLSYHCFLLFV